MITISGHSLKSLPQMKPPRAEEAHVSRQKVWAWVRKEVIA